MCARMKGEACWQCGKEKPAGLLEHSGKNPASFCTTDSPTCVYVSVCFLAHVCLYFHADVPSLKCVCCTCVVSECVFACGRRTD